MDSLSSKLTSLPDSSLHSNHETWLDELSKPIATATLGAFGDHNVGTIDKVNGYLKDFVKAVPLFFEGPAGYIGAAAGYAADAAHPADSIHDQIINGAFGAGEGLTLKGGMQYLSGTKMSAAFRGVTLGLGSSAAHIAFNPETFRDGDGHLSAATGVNNFEHQFFSGSTLLGAAESAATFTVAEYGLGRLNYKMRGAFERSPYLPTIATGATMGITSGAINETVKEANDGKGIHPLNIIGNAFAEGVIGGAAAGPAGYLEARASLLPGRTLTDSTVSTVPSAQEALSRSNAHLDQAQTELQNAPFQVQRHITNNVYSAGYSDTDGVEHQAIFRTIDDNPMNVHRFQNEMLAYKVSQGLGTDTIPLTVGSEKYIDGVLRVGYLQDVRGRSFEEHLEQQAGSHDFNDMTKFLLSKPEYSASYKTAWMHRMTMQEWDNHGHQFLTDKKLGAPHVLAVDYEYGDPQAKYKQDLVPDWGKTASRASLLNETIARNLSGAPLPSGLQAAAAKFVDQYSTPEGLEELSQVAANDAQVAGVLGRIKWFADNGTLPIKRPTNIFTYGALKALHLASNGRNEYGVTSE